MSRHTIRYAITDRSRYGPTASIREAALLRQTEHLARTGADFIQLREKDLGTQELLHLTRRMLNILQQANSATRLFVNSRADVASAAGAHGVHIPSGKDELTPAQARRVMRLNGPVVSVSCHTLEDVERARDNAADLILFGPVYEKSIAGQIVVPGTGLDALAKACCAAGSVPVLALGGITLKNTASCVAAGARGIASIRLFQQPAD